MVVKYSTTPVNNTIKTNNIVLGTDTGDYGPTASTGFWNGITPPSSGYTIYTVSESKQEPNIVVASNNNEVIYFAKSFGGTNINTIGEALSYLVTGSTGTTIVNMNYPSIVTNGLVLNLDAGFVPSYPKYGNICRDLSGNNIIGTFTGNTSFNSEVNGNFLFDGNNDYIELSSLTPYSNTQPHTYCAWFKPHSGGGNYYWLINNGTNANGTSLIQYQSRIGFFYSGGGAYQAGNTSMSLNQWHYIVASYNGNTSVTFYLDGAFDGTQSPGGSWTATNNTPRLGGWYNGGYSFDGQMSVVQVYNRALIQSDVTQNFNAQKSRFGL